MNRKLVNGLLLLALTSGGCGVFTSCKDTNEDFYNKVVAGQVDLGDRVADLEKYTGYVKGWTQTIPDMIQANKDQILNELNPQLQELDTKLNGLLNDPATNGAEIADIKGQMATVNTQISDLVSKNAALEGDLAALQTTVDALEAKLADYKPGITQEDLDTAIQGLKVILQQQIDTLNADLATVKTDVANVKTEVATVSADLAQLTTDFNADHAQLLQTVADVATNAAKIEALDNNVTELTSTVDNLALEFGDLYTEINDKGGLKDQIRELNAKVEGALDRITNNEADIDTLYQLVETNQQNIRELQNLTAKYFTNINEVLNLRVSDILLNQTWNPMFGALNLPFGLATTIAANYYGYSDHQLNFPLDIYSADYEVLHNNSGINKIGQTAINNLLSSLKGEGQILVNAEKVYMNEGENNLGQLYLSINPTHIDTENIKFELVTSAGKTAPIDVKVVESDKELTFGVTRSAANGFYQANLHVDPANAPEIGIRVQEGLKSAMKDALTGHTKSDFAQLAKVLMQQMQNILPAYGVKATWEEPSTTFPNASEEPVTRTYISKYEVAATAMRPLGYEFMQGQGASKDLLPTVGSLKEAFDKAFDEIGDKINIKIPFDDIKGLDFEGLNIDFKINDISFAEDAPKIEINLGGIKVEGDKTIGFNPDGTPITEWGVIGEVPEGQTITLTYNPNVTPGDPGVEIGDGALNEFLDEVTGKINGMLADINGQINDDLIKQVNDLIENKIKGQVNDMIGSINDQLQDMGPQINDQIKDILADIKSSLLGKLGRVDNLVDKYNKIANKVNEFLKDPNHYLQVTMFYNAGNGNLGELSSNINYPTHFKTAGGNALTLYATSYTAELIAPSYKKYVAVSRAWKADGTEVTFNENGGPAAANATEFLNEVRPGNQQRFALDTKNLQKGYKYEVIYSSLDYQGYTSTRTFYLVVD